MAWVEGDLKDHLHPTPPAMDRDATWLDQVILSSKDEGDSFGKVVEEYEDAEWLRRKIASRD